MSEAARSRPTQAQRSAKTKSRVLKAAIHCLRVHGYAATTMMLVAEEAEISRGAMLHQFPTKADLMLFVVRSAYDDEVERFKACLKSKHTEADLHMVLWDTFRRPFGVATLEVLLGARSDAKLAAKLIPLQAQIERESFQVAGAMHHEGGDLVSQAWIRLTMWAMRGFAMADVLSNKPEELLEMVEIFRNVMVSYRERELRNRGANPTDNPGVK